MSICVLKCKFAIFILIFCTYIDAAKGGSMTGWFYFDEFPFLWSNATNSWHYLKLVENKLWSFNYGSSQWSLLQTGHEDLGIYEQVYNEKVNEIQANPSTYGLFSESENEARKIIGYNEGFKDGLDSLNPKPITVGLAPVSLAGLDIISVTSGGLITKFDFDSNGQSASGLQAGASENFDYIWEKINQNTGFLSLNSVTTIIHGQITYSSSNSGTFSLTYRDISTKAIQGTYSGTFSQ